MSSQPQVKQQPGVVRRIAAAAAHGFELACSTKPRGAAAWVEHCRNAAAAAHASILAEPPILNQRVGQLEAILMQLEDRPHLLKRSVGFEAPGIDDDDEGPDLSLAHNRPQLEHQLEGEELAQAAHDAASRAYRASMPLMTSRSNTAAFIACLAVAGAQGFVTAQEARSLGYAAQLALTAFPRRKGK